MESIVRRMYDLDPSVAENESVIKLIELMQPVYMVSDEPISEDGGELSLRDTQVEVGEVNSVVLGVWPLEGPIKRMTYGSESKMNMLLEEGVIVREHSEYDTDNITGKPMIPFRLSEDYGQLRKRGLEKMTPGQTIYFFLEPK